MQTEQELIQELYQNEAIHAKIKEGLAQFKKDRFNDSIKSLHYLINKCFKFVGTSQNFCYKIIAITDSQTNSITCDVIVIVNDEINYQSKFNHILHDDIVDEITLVQFESTMDTIYHNLKYKIIN